MPLQLSGSCGTPGHDRGEWKRHSQPPCTNDRTPTKRPRLCFQVLRRSHPIFLPILFPLGVTLRYPSTEIPTPVPGLLCTVVQVVYCTTPDHMEMAPLPSCSTAALTPTPPEEVIRFAGVRTKIGTFNLTSEETGRRSSAITGCLRSNPFLKIEFSAQYQSMSNNTREQNMCLNCHSGNWDVTNSLQNRKPPEMGTFPPLRTERVLMVLQQSLPKGNNVGGTKLPRTQSQRP